MERNGQDGSAEGPHTDRLDVRAQLSGSRLLVMGGTGFLGKVWFSMLLHHFPEVEHIFLVVRARKRGDAVVQSSEERFWSEIAPSPVFDPIRERFPGGAYEAMLREKVTVIPGDVTEPFAGVPLDVRDRMRGTLTAIVNASGVVDFNPPLDYALNVNAFGMQNLVDLARDLGGESSDGVPFVHTSTAYVAGGRTGQVDEVDPREHPFPKANELERSHWDPEREIAECVDLVESVRHRSNDAFRQSHFLDQAKKNLLKKGEPTRGTALDDELAKVKRRFEEAQLVDWGTERAQYWGWHNIYTYTKSIGEQILAASGVPFVIARPAVIESAVAYPKTGWNEGINTSAPVIYLAMKGPVVYPKEDETCLDIIPVDQVAAGMILTLAELIEGRHRVVYHYGTSDTNGLNINRLIELVGLFKRRHYVREAGGNPVLNWVQSRLEPESMTAADYNKWGPHFRSEKVGQLSKLVGKFAEGPLEALAGPASSALAGLSKGISIQARITDQFIPFMATHNYRFSCANVRAAHSRLDDDDKRLLDWSPERIDWRHYLLEVHGPGLQKNVTPLIDEKIKKMAKPIRPHDDLVSMLDNSAEHHDLAPALLRTHEDGFTVVSYRELRLRTIATAARLQAAGVEAGHRVMLSAANHPDWATAYFGILRLGAVAVPLDPGLDRASVQTIQAASGAVAAVLDAETAAAFDTDLPVHDIHEVTAPDASAVLSAPTINGSDLASILYTSGTTGVPKGVMLSHANFCALIASVSGVFSLRETDRLLSVLPLHHAFEFGCGLLLPLSKGARIIYLDSIDGDRLAYGLKEGRVTCMVGVPALWQLLERRIRSQVKTKGELFNLGFDLGLDLNRKIGKGTGLDLGKMLFGSVHSKFGGNIRLLISGGAALPKDTQVLFSGLGLHLSEGYGLTEASPVLTVARARPGSKSGHVGKAIPGVELKIDQPDKDGVGEVWARGPNVMQGYFGNERASAETVDADGWLHTGDMGRIDHKDRLFLVGRAKEVVVTSSGENVYLDDAENLLGTIKGVEEYTLVGIDDPRGGERLGMLARAADGVNGSDAREQITEALARLSSTQRPSVVHLVDAPLPRTATRKVQRREARKSLEKIIAATPTVKRGEGLNGPVARAIAGVAGVEADAIQMGTNLLESHGFDSLMWVELASALEGIGSGSIDPVVLSRCETAADVVKLVGAPPAPVDDSDEGPGAVDLPAPLASALKEGMGMLQRTLNGALLNTRVTGRANIPQNRTAIVVSNHTSHLDMGLVKHALGPYGDKMTALAAKDYFFEGNRWKVAYFEHLTNITPLDRKAGFRTSLRQAIDVVERGRIVLIFPEGTRQTSGQLAEFKPLIGKIAMDAGVDILPLHIEGAYRALPKGSVLPKNRNIHVRIGPPLAIEDLRTATEGESPGNAARKVARLAHAAVEALSKGDVLDLSRTQAGEAMAAAEAPTETPEMKVAAAFEGLAKRYDPERIERSVSWYFSLGEVKYSVAVTAEECTVQPGRPSTGSADCVIKATPDMINRLICEGYVPTPAEFMSGAIKTNDIPLLIEFSRVFDLTEFDGQ
jgi:long-chain acyl-CoA synthetase